MSHQGGGMSQPRPRHTNVCPESSSLAAQKCVKLEREHETLCWSAPLSCTGIKFSQAQHFSSGFRAIWCLRNGENLTNIGTEGKHRHIWEPVNIHLHQRLLRATGQWYQQCVFHSCGVNQQCTCTEEKTLTNQNNNFCRVKSCMWDTINLCAYGQKISLCDSSLKSPRLAQVRTYILGFYSV